MARQRKPTGLKLLTGTLRADRDGVVAPLLERLNVVPEPPGWLPNEFAVREWSTLAPRLVQCGVLTAEMVSPLGHLCSLHGMLCESWMQKSPPNAAIITAYRQLAASFGLTPADLSRVSKPPRTTPNKFTRLSGQPWLPAGRIKDRSEET